MQLNCLVFVEYQGEIGVRGALSCAMAGVTGTATKLQKAWADGALFDSEHQVSVQQELPGKTTLKASG